jgi:hypothetical protein
MIAISDSKILADSNRQHPSIRRNAAHSIELV